MTASCAEHHTQPKGSFKLQGCCESSLYLPGVPCCYLCSSYFLLRHFVSIGIVAKGTEQERQPDLSVQRRLFCVPSSGFLSKGYCLRIGGEKVRSSWSVTPLRLKQERTAQMCLEFSPSPLFFRNGSLSVAPVAHQLISYTLIFHSSNVQESSDSLLGFEASFFLKKKKKVNSGSTFPR